MMSVHDELKEALERAFAAEAQCARWKANHDSVVQTKRGTDARLKTALAALQKIYDVAGESFEEATTNKRDFLKETAERT